MAKQTNEQKYKTAEERVEAFLADMKASLDTIAGTVAEDFAHWLALEAKENEKPENCPFCGGECKSFYDDESDFLSPWQIQCESNECCYQSQVAKTEAEAVAAHNRVARAVRAANDKEK